MSNVCKRCNGTDIDDDPALGVAVCTNCGLVLQENKIVAEVEFAETGLGGHSVVGQFIGADRPQRFSGPGGAVYGIGRESREVTFQNGRRRIEKIACQLRINQQQIDEAFCFFKSAVSMSLTQGRRSEVVAASVLYISCRLAAKTEHLLLDFSDVIKVNVYDLGKTLNALCRKLFITLPNIDPCSYVMRFANAMKFGDKEHEVSTMAMRLVRRMKRDWMAVGRRPSGICGAALILAARYHNFNRTVQDVVKVVQIGESAVRHRLNEFACTASANLTLDEFSSVDLDEEADPPAFYQAKQKAKLKSENVADADLSTLESELLVTGKQVEDALVKRLPDKKTPSLSKKVVGDKRKAGSTFFIEPIASCSEGDDSNQERLKACDRLLEQDILNSVISPQDQVNFETPEMLLEKYKDLAPTLQSLGISKCESAPLEANELDPADVQTETFSDISDTEIDAYMLTEPEVLLKTRLWMAENGTFMEEMEARRRLREQEALERDQQHPSKKRAKRPRKKQIQAATAGEAIEKIVQEKKLSSKINYEMLKNLITPASFLPKSSSVSKFEPPCELKSVSLEVNEAGS